MHTCLVMSGAAKVFPPSTFLMTVGLPGQLDISMCMSRKATLDEISICVGRQTEKSRRSSLLRVGLIQFLECLNNTKALHPPQEKE